MADNFWHKYIPRKTYSQEEEEEEVGKTHQKMQIRLCIIAFKRKKGLTHLTFQTYILRYNYVHYM